MAIVTKLTSTASMPRLSHIAAALARWRTRLARPRKSRPLPSRYRAPMFAEATRSTLMVMIALHAACDVVPMGSPTSDAGSIPDALRDRLTPLMPELVTAPFGTAASLTAVSGSVELTLTQGTLWDTGPAADASTRF